RMLPLGTWEQCRPQLEKYVAKGTHAELQMGAVSGLADVDAPPVAVLLRDAAGYAPEGNRNLAIAALLRTPQRRQVLSQAIKDGTIRREWLSEEQLDELTR